jgi:putative hydrolase of the HAD superfamily
VEGGEDVQFRAVIFDLYGTLIEERVNNLGQMARKLGLPEAAFAKRWAALFPARGKGQMTSRDCVIQLCKEFALEIAPDVIEEAAELRMAEARANIRATRFGATEVLTGIRGLGLQTGLLSNASLETARLWGASPLALHFTDALFSCDVGMMKPEREIYQLACKRLGVEPKQCVFVGDNGDSELAGAASVGMTPVQIRTARALAPEAAYVVGSLAEVLSLPGLQTIER